MGAGRRLKRHRAKRVAPAQTDIHGFGLGRHGQIVDARMVGHDGESMAAHPPIMSLGSKLMVTWRQ